MPATAASAAEPGAVSSAAPTAPTTPTAPSAQAATAAVAFIASVAPGADLAHVVVTANSGQVAVTEWTVSAGTSTESLRTVGTAAATDGNTLSLEVALEGPDMVLIVTGTADGAVVGESRPLARDAVAQKFVAVGGVSSRLGAPVGDRYLTGDHVTQDFTRGRIYALAGFTNSAIGGEVYDKYTALGGSTVLGLPIGDGGADASASTAVLTVANGGTITWSTTAGAHFITATAQKWSQYGGASAWFGFPTTDEAATPDGQGSYAHFERASVYRLPSGRQYLVFGAIRDKWAATGWERGPLGYPTTDEMTTPDGVGRYQHFERGSVYWTPQTGAHPVELQQRSYWESLGWERGPLGYPTTDTLRTPDGLGSYQHFQYGSIYRTPSGLYAAVYGAFHDKWAAAGWERGPLGYPTWGEEDFAGGRRQKFERGSLYWSPGTGTHILTGRISDARTQWPQSDFLGLPVTDGSRTPDGAGEYAHFQFGSLYVGPSGRVGGVNGDILAKWASMGWERSCLGYPEGFEHDGDTAGTRIQVFTRGTITWSASTGKTAVTCY